LTPIPVINGLKFVEKGRLKRKKEVIRSKKFTKKEGVILNRRRRIILVRRT
jgi:hypothetical protein